jgi:hypothetical protein
MNIGEPRRTIYIEPIEEPSVEPTGDPAPTEPAPAGPSPDAEPQPAD